jgi:alkylhydroperoxidase family enzyme
MEHTTRIPPAEITGVKGAVIKRMIERKLGKVPTAVGVYWHNPKVLFASFGLGGKLQKWDACDEGLKSFAHMAVASLVGCTWCLDFNYFEARNKGLDVVKAREIPRWRESADFTPLERDVLEYAEAMSHTPPTVSDELVDRLHAELGPAAVVELTSVIAFANMSTRGNVALGIESDGFAAACGLRPLAERPGVASAAWARTRSSPPAACCSPSPTRCSALSRTPRTWCRRPGCGGRPCSTPSAARSGTRVRTSCAS